ncbi:MAG: hypothetical protein KJ548_10330 [Actinobacteria bacterium]|nr:hypothetical protein [Actinomycetota bacterium]MBU4336958.1 hypothetical protein [Actinomycetota bacterium]MCG2802425.1 hypothetical protein [Cellulomonas sp.]
MSSAHLAVDGGNSKTVAVVVDQAGLVLGRGRGGCGDIYGAASPRAAVEAVTGAIGQALVGAGLEPPDVDNAVLRLAGADWPEDARYWTEQLADLVPGLRRVEVGNDALASLRLVDRAGVGLCVTVGTGPAVGARSAAGREAWTGLWVFDDLGGGGLGRSSFEAVMRAWMGTGPSTLLTPALLDMYGAPDEPTLHHQFTRRFDARPDTERWRAARLVLQIAEQGDPVALAIVERQARALVGYAGWVAREVGEDLADGNLPVLLNGSVVTSEHPAMRRALLSDFADLYPGAVVSVSRGTPLAGAVLDALASGGVALDDGLVDRVVGTAHPADFLIT